MSEFITSLDGLSIAERERRMLERGPDRMSYTPVQVTEDLTIFASMDAGRWDGVRLPVSGRLHALLCKQRGTVQPVAIIEDAIWAAAIVKLVPSPDPRAVREGRMHKLRAALDHHERIETMRARAYGLVRGWKSWVLDRGVERAHPDRAINYGWHVPEGARAPAPTVVSKDGKHRVIQTTVAPERAHFLGHTDYSQLFTEYLNRAIYKGVEMKLSELLAGRHDAKVARELGGPFMWPHYPAVHGDPIVASPSGPPPVTTLGDRGATVGRWQRHLKSWDTCALPRWGVDEHHGRETEEWTQRYMETHGLMRDGKGGFKPKPSPSDLVIVPQRVKPASFRQAKHYYAGRLMGPPIWIIMHTAQTIEANYAAESLQTYGATMADGRQVSWHAAGDSDSIRESVRPEHTAFAAPGANQLGYHFELAGSAFQTPEQWADGFTTGALSLAAGYLADMAEQLRIPKRRIGVEEMLALEPGFAGHMDVRDACREARRRGLKQAPWWRADRGSWASTSHGDPGPDFPWDAFMAAVRAA